MLDVYSTSKGNFKQLEEMKIFTLRKTKKYFPPQIITSHVCIEAHNQIISGGAWNNRRAMVNAAIGFGLGGDDQDFFVFFEAWREKSGPLLDKFIVQPGAHRRQVYRNEHLDI